jgi:hypothetical protein
VWKLARVLCLAISQNHALEESWRFHCGEGVDVLIIQGHVVKCSENIVDYLLGIPGEGQEGTLLATFPGLKGDLLRCLLAC